MSSFLQRLRQIFGFTVSPPASPVTPPPLPHPAPAPWHSPSPAPVVVSSNGPLVAIVNNSSVVNDAQIAAAVAALQIQITRDFAPVWKITAHLMAVQTGKVPPADAWVIHVMDTSDQAGALGYHDLTPAGNPIGKVFAKDDQKYGLSWTVTLSHELCLSGDTKIPLLDGSCVAIRDLVGKDEFWVYSCTDEGEIRPGRGHSARLTKKQARIVEVRLDNGETVKCTPDHPFMLRDGSFKEAGLLTSGDSLMPLYRRKEKIDPAKKTSSKFLYEQVYNPGSDEWKYTHRIAVPFCPSGYVRHHKDFNRFNNLPDNIEVMLWDDHRKLHANHIRHYAELFAASGQKRKLTEERRRELAETGAAKFRAYNGSEKHKSDLESYWSKPGRREAVGERLKEWASSEENKNRLLDIVTSDDFKNRAKERLTLYNQSDAHRELAVEIGRKAMDRLWADPEFRQRKAERDRSTAKRLWADPEFRAKRQDEMHTRLHLEKGKTGKKCDLCRQAAEPINHKVVDVVECGFEDVYDITVDNFHNFAVESGVFVHNCEMLVDPWIENVAFNQQTNTSGTLYAFEVCDACEDDRFGYAINGILVSDFVYPAWFEGWRQPNSTKFDFRGILHAPLTLAAGGYIGAFAIPNTRGWETRTAETAPSARLLSKGVYSRTKRRGKPLA